MKNENKIYIWQNNKDRLDSFIDGIIIQDYDRRQEDDSKYMCPERPSGENRRSTKDEKVILLVTDNPHDERLVLGVFQKFY